MKNIFLIVSLGILFSVNQNVTAQTKAKFKVVLDAGHGGNDPGKTVRGLKEKDITLDITLKVGALLDKYSDTQIIYSRKTDVSVSLKDRATNANKHDADLFVSIHCNADPNSNKAFGTETFIMGMARANMNLEVSKRENSVILLEENYKEKYNGFDPNKPESLVGLKILQEEVQSQSFGLAAKIERNFKHELKRKSRGVKQQPLWVLDATVMPGVLIETGFLTNVEEADYLASEKGQNEISRAIANAVIEYKNDMFHTSSVLIVSQEEKESSVKETEQVEETIVKETPKTETKAGIMFKVQIAASKNKLEPTASNFKGLKPISREKDGSLYKYFYGEETDYDTIKKRLEQATAKGYKSAFVVAYKDGVKISIADAVK